MLHRLFLIAGDYTDANLAYFHCSSLYIVLLLFCCDYIVLLVLTEISPNIKSRGLPKEKRPDVTRLGRHYILLQLLSQLLFDSTNKNTFSHA